MLQTSFKEPIDSGTQLMYATVVLDLDKLNKALQSNVKELQLHCKTVFPILFGIYFATILLSVAENLSTIKHNWLHVIWRLPHFKSRFIEINALNWDIWRISKICLLTEGRSDDANC